jgi:hypothetical protein
MSATVDFGFDVLKFKVKAVDMSALHINHPEGELYAFDMDSVDRTGCRGRGKIHHAR